MKKSMKIVFDDGIFSLLNHILTGAGHPVDVRLAPTGVATETSPSQSVSVPVECPVDISQEYLRY